MENLEQNDYKKSSDTKIWSHIHKGRELKSKIDYVNSSKEFVLYDLINDTRILKSDMNLGNIQTFNYTQNSKNPDTNNLITAVYKFKFSIESDIEHIHEMLSCASLHQKWLTILSSNNCVDLEQNKTVGTNTIYNTSICYSKLNIMSVANIPFKYVSES